MNVSIIFPTYNRANFLPEAFESIRLQTFTDWELIIVDDGGTDNTAELIPELTAGWTQPVRYHRQENQGAYGARNTGLDLAQSKYIAFFDSDDLWLPHHLKDCVTALEQHPEVDWVWGACQIKDHETDTILAPSTFYVDGKPRSFMQLHHKQVGALRIIDDTHSIPCALLAGFYCGLQNSVLRRSLFDNYRFHALHRNGGDQVIVIRFLTAGKRFAYLDNVHVIYNQHSQNSSAAGSDCNLEKHLTIYRSLVCGFEEMVEQVPLQGADHRALRKRLNHEYFWNLGYSLLWQNGQRKEALAMFRRGLRWWPWDWRCWKTYLIALIRNQLAAPPSSSVNRSESATG